jgi:glycosyltransferase involved in cell wall biosynthesis
VRVLAYLHSYPPHRLLGGEMMTSRLLEALVGAGHEVKVLSQAVRKEFTHNGVRIVPQRLNVSRGDLCRTSAFISHPEIAHFVSTRATSLGVPYVGIVHNLEDRTVEELRRTVPELLIANADPTAAEVTRLAPRARVEVIRPPSLSAWSREPSAPLGRHFVTLVNLSPAKGSDLFYRLAAARPDLHFLGVLGGYGEQDRRDLPNVTIMGQTPDMGLVYAMSRVVLMPSQKETYGMVAAEACLHGVPVIAAGLPGLFDALGAHADYVDPDNVDGWLDVLAELDDPATYASRSQRALERGRFVEDRSRDDLTRWVKLIEGLA